MPEEKMYFIRNMRLLTDDDYSINEYEIIVDADFRGEFDNGLYQLMIWEFSNKIAGEEQKLCIRLKVGNIYNSWQSSDGSKYYHGGGIEEEIICMASLAFRRRFKLGAMVRRKDKPCYLPRFKKDALRGGWINSELINGTSNLSDLSKILKLVEGLKHEYHQKFIWALKLYNRSIAIIEEEPDIAYLHLVSAIESLCQDTIIEQVHLSEINGKLSKLVNEIEDMSLRNKIKNSIIKRERFISRKFVKFILDHVEDDFWNNDNINRVAVKITSEELPKLLKNIYNQRSVTSHAGEPFPPYIFDSPIPQGSDILGALDVTHMGRRWDKKEFIPYLPFFEGLINHVLLSFLKKNQRYVEYSVINFPVLLYDKSLELSNIYYF